jgi:butyrate kinase
MKLILAINPGSTSTKIAVFEESKQVFVRNIQHPVEDIKHFNKVTDQLNFRKEIIRKELNNSGLPLKYIKAIVGRGGLIKPVASGIIEVNDALKRDLYNSPLGEHASNLGGLIADELAKEMPDTKAFIVDPVVVDEFEDIARISGHPLFERKSIFHPLNQKAVVRAHANSLNKKYEEMNFIVAHMGGGITIGAHKKGRVIDVNNGLDAEGPITPERSGNLPIGDVVNLCFSGKYSKEDVKLMLKGKGGFVAYFGTNNAYDIEKRAEAGDEKAALLQDALAYQVAKFIGAMSTVLKGEVDAILLTGGLAFGKPIVDNITSRVSHIAQVFVYPGEDEMRALAMNGFRALSGDINIIDYH